MPDLDEFLRHELRRTVRQFDVNRVSSRIDIQRTRRARGRKVQSVALAMVVLAGTVVGVAMMSVAPRNQATEPIAATPAPALEDIGLGFPVCDVTTSVGNWGGPGTVMYFATKTNDSGGCPTPGDDVSQVVGLDQDGDGKIDVDLGPIPCLGSCRFFAAPDIDRDGRRELTMVQGVNGSSALIRIFSVDASGTPALVPWQDHGKDLLFAWDTSTDHQAGAFCDRGRAGPEFVVWNAERIGPGHYRETQIRYDVDGTTAEVDFERSHTRTFEVPEDEPVLPRLDGLCGTTFNNTWGTA